MQTASLTPDERARKAISLVLQRLTPEGTQRNLAQIWGVSESSVSRLKEHIEPIAKLCAHVGIKWVPVELKCYPPREIDAMFVLAKANMNRADSVDDVLKWDE